MFSNQPGYVAVRVANEYGRAACSQDPIDLAGTIKPSIAGNRLTKCTSRRQAIAQQLRRL